MFLSQHFAIFDGCAAARLLPAEIGGPACGSAGWPRAGGGTWRRTDPRRATRLISKCRGRFARLAVDLSSETQASRLAEHGSEGLGMRSPESTKKRFVLAGIAPCVFPASIEATFIEPSLLELVTHADAARAADFTLLCDVDGQMFDLPTSADGVHLLLSHFDLIPGVSAKQASALRDKIRDREQLPVALVLLARTGNEGLALRMIEKDASRSPVYQDAVRDLVRSCANVFSSLSVRAALPPELEPYLRHLILPPRHLLAILNGSRSTLGQEICRHALQRFQSPRHELGSDLARDLRVSDRPALRSRVLLGEEIHSTPLLRVAQQLLPTNRHSVLDLRILSNDRVPQDCDKFVDLVSFLHASDGTVTAIEAVKGDLTYALFFASAMLLTAADLRSRIATGLQEYASEIVSSKGNRRRKSKRYVGAAVADTGRRRQHLPSPVLRVAVEGFDWKKLLFAYNSDTRKVGFVYGGQVAGAKYLPEIDGLGNRKSEGQLTQHGRLFEYLLTTGEHGIRSEDIMKASRCTPRGIREVVRNLNRALLEYVFPGGDAWRVVPPIRFVHKAGVYGVAFGVRHRADPDGDEVAEMFRNYASDDAAYSNG